MSNPKTHFRGSCACARLTYTSASPPSATTTCFCTTCRKLSGSSSQTFTHIPASALTLYDNAQALRYEGLPRESVGAVRILRLSEFAERAVCVDCGAGVAMRYRAREGEVGVLVGSVDGEVEGLRAEKAIFVGSKPGWVEMGDFGGRRHERFPDGVEEVIMGWRGGDGGEKAEKAG